MELTLSQQDEMIHDERQFERDIDVGFKKCEICCEKYLDEDIRTAVVDDVEGEVCVYCLENLKLDL